jgi:hypothetical protein
VKLDDLDSHAVPTTSQIELPAVVATALRARR